MVRWPSGLRRQLKVLLPSTSYNRWSERAWVQIPLSSTFLLLLRSARYAVSIDQLRRAAIGTAIVVAHLRLELYRS